MYQGFYTHSVTAPQRICSITLSDTIWLLPYLRLSNENAIEINKL